MARRVLRRGRVLDTHGNPVAGATVAVEWGTAAVPDIGRRTAPDGVFQIGLPEGRFRLLAVCPDRKTARAEVDGGDGEEIVLRVKD